MDDWRYEMRRELQEIVPGVFLGPFSACRQFEELKATGITHVVCFVDQNEARLFRTENLAQYFHYQQFIVSDSNLQNLIQYFPNTSEYIHNVISQQGKVVVCCNGGMSRSPTFVIAYVMEVFKIDASQAYHFVQGRRLCINPNDGFKSQLKEYEPIYKARQSNTHNDDRQSNRRRRRSDPDEETQEHSQQPDRSDSKRLSRLQDQNSQQNVNPGYTSMLL
ncbi:protein-tyrosine phosphatase-like protein [Mucor mucedo]|uniref:protein-tyrosine phosphatase-like protein n=1 Tax=Mucor mucedo TaxID=29922 RepID=UPI00221F28DB|nr:protein-tyrosine phosphatase-like protein [Mucor mucedo]KAI7890858.1 protein-tyrosine phosphatase-like protein [Mucor mucedo]